MKTIEENRIRSAAMECGNAQGWDISPFIANGFLRGARWMERTLLQDLWHDASETPEKGKPCLVHGTRFHGDSEPAEFCFASTYTIFGWSGKRFPYNDCVVKRWCYIDDLLPNEQQEENLRQENGNNNETVDICKKGIASNV